MLKSPLIPTVLSIFTFMFGCSSIEINKVKKNQYTKIVETYTSCPEPTKIIEQKGLWLLCGKKNKAYYSHLTLLKQSDKQYTKYYEWPAEQKFLQQAGVWYEYYDLKLEKNIYKKVRLNHWAWQCEQLPCEFKKTSCTIKNQQAHFPNLKNKLVQKKISPKKEVLIKLTDNALRGDISSYKILATYPSWFNKDDISYKYANYLLNEVREKTRSACIQTKPPYWANL